MFFPVRVAGRVLARRGTVVEHASNMCVEMFVYRCGFSRFKRFRKFAPIQQTPSNHKITPKLGCQVHTKNYAASTIQKYGTKKRLGQAAIYNRQFEKSPIHTNLEHECILSG